MKDELERVWRAAVVDYFKALSWNLPGRIKKSRGRL
jgi:hypothetical protein